MILGMILLACGGAHAAVIDVGTETHVTSGAAAPACTPPDECISETAAIEKYGVNGYEMTGKTICGQTADAMVQYYCIHPVAAAPAAAATSAAPPAATTAVPATATQKSPVGIVTIFAAIGAGLLAAATRRK